MKELTFLSAVLISVAAYLIGSVNFSVIISRRYYKDDVRSHASGNAGATNMGRTFGLAAGLGTLVGDIIKTAVAMVIGILSAGKVGGLIAYIFCFVGHCWPVFFGFKGGKGVSVAFAAMFFVDLRLFAVMIITFFSVVLTTKYVSLSSISAAFSLVPASLLMRLGLSPALFASIFTFVTVAVMHRANIKRLLTGTERKFQLKKH